MMDRIRAAWERLTASPRRFALAAAVAAVAVTGGIGYAIAVNGVRQAEVGAAPSDFATADPSATATADADERAAASPSPTESPSSTPGSSQMPDATIAPASSSDPTPVPSSAPEPPAVATPEPTPEPTPFPSRCDTFVWSPSPTVSVSSLAELEDGMVGTWEGCVSTPWVPVYWVTITFRADGTYSGYAEENLYGEPAFYYGTDEDSPEKLYELNDLQDDLEGIGQIDIVFWAGNTNRGELRNIRLTGDELEFEFFHRGEYGPLRYQLTRTSN